MSVLNKKIIINKQQMNMKKIVNYAVPALCVVAIAFSVAAFNQTCAATNPSTDEATQITTVMAGQPVDLTYAAEKSLPSVVHIKYVQNSKVQTVKVQRDPFEDFFDPFGGFFGRGQGGTQERKVQTPKKTATGSGVIISTDGYIVTNNHVVDGADELTVTLNDNSEYSARIIGADKTTDLALIKIDGKNLPAITIANSDNVKVGEWVLAVGNPLGLNNTVTAGIISAKARTLGANSVESFIQTDAAINAGNSGGALVNTRGELVGINAMLYSQTGSYSGYGFAIPTTIMNKVVDDIKNYGTVQRAMIGISGMDVKGYVDALVTAPLNPSLLKSDAFQYQGQSDYLSTLFDTPDYVEMLVSDYLRIGMVTSDIAVKEAVSVINKELVMHKLIILANALKKDFNIASPKIAVLGLNPHAGDSGLAGKEEHDIIAPVISMAQKNALFAFGPFPADYFFASGKWRKYDAVLAMYHDQAALPFKMISVNGGSIYTAGLPVVRTSPFHGPAYDIANKNEALPDAMRHAVFLALDILNARQ